MAVKKYQLVTDKAEPFAREGIFKFQVRYDLTEDGATRIVALKKAPVISIPADGGVVQTENETAQTMIENMTAPNKTLRNGVARTSGLLFTDVTVQDPTADVDLDEYFV